MIALMCGITLVIRPRPKQQVRNSLPLVSSETSAIPQPWWNLRRHMICTPYQIMTFFDAVIYASIGPNPPRINDH